MASTIHLIAQTIISQTRIRTNIQPFNCYPNPALITDRFRAYIESEIQRLQLIISQHMSTTLGKHERKKIKRELENIQLIFDTAKSATRATVIVKTLTAITTLLPLTIEHASQLRDLHLQEGLARSPESHSR